MTIQVPTKPNPQVIAAPAKPAVKTSAVGFSSLQTNVKKEVILLLAKAKEGKTTCALTASKKYNPAAPGSGVVIDDIAVMSFEKTGLGAAQKQGYDFAYLVDMSGQLDLGLVDFQRTLYATLAMVKQTVIDKKLEAFVFDGITVLEAAWSVFLAPEFKGFHHSRELNHKHYELLRFLNSFPCHVIVPMHIKPIGKIDADKRESTGLDKDDKFSMHIAAWDGPALYRALCSVTIPLKRHTGKTYKEDQYFLHPRGVDGIEAGGRYSHLSAHEKIPANMQDLFAAIAGPSAA